jgi:predicted nucleic acid-binding Zn ribbon protein
MPRQSKNPPHFNLRDEADAEEWRQWYRKGGWKQKARRCENCHGFYYPVRRRQKFCSEKCGEAVRWQRRKTKELARRRAAKLAARPPYDPDSEKRL